MDMTAVDAQGNEIGKIFVGGLSQETNDGSLRKHFEKFGQVLEATVMMDPHTGRSRGFGYVRFDSQDQVTKALEEKTHSIDGKVVDAKQCNQNMRGQSRRNFKIFVGGIAPEQNEEDIHSFFSDYGTVTDVNLMKDTTRQRHRGFAFVAFSDMQVVKDLIEKRHLTIKGRPVEIKPMEPPKMRQRHMGNGPFPPGAPMTGIPIFGTGRGGRGRGRGGPPGGGPHLTHMHPHAAQHMHPPEWAQGASWAGGWNPTPWNGPSAPPQWAPAHHHQPPNSMWQSTGRQGDHGPSWDHQSRQMAAAWTPHWQQQAAQQAHHSHMGHQHQAQQQQQPGMWSWEPHTASNQWSAQMGGPGEQTATAGANMAL